MKWLSVFVALWLAAAPAAYASVDGDADTPPAAAGTFAGRSWSDARELVLQAMGFLGIRYHYGGISPETGFDCSGLVTYVFNQVAGLVLPHNARAISRVGEKISRDELRPGDLVFFNTLRRPFSHVGIYLGEHRFIHAPSRGGAVEIVNMSDRYWRRRYNGARRIDF